MGPVPPAAIDHRRRTWRRRPRPRRSRAPLLRRLRQDPASVRHWLLVAVLAWVLAALVSQALGRAQRAEQRWGHTTVVWVADRPLRAGDGFAGALRPEQWPRALVPASAIRASPTPSARARAAVDAGTVVTAAMVDRGGTVRRTVSVPLPDAHLPVEEGDRVDVWATTDGTSTNDGAATTRRVASGARVVRSTTGSVVLEVAPGQVATLAGAGATATLFLVGGP